jgi:hypothetical protein
MKAMKSIETSETSHPSTRRHIPKDLNPQQDRCKNLKFRKVQAVGGGGHTVAQLVEALRYKPEGSIPDGVIGIFY